MTTLQNQFLREKSLESYSDTSVLELLLSTAGVRGNIPDMMSMAFLQMAGVFSELELSMIRARVRSGMANAKAKGKQIGRKPVTKDDLPTVFLKYYPAYMKGTMNITELARVCGLTRPTIYKYIQLHESQE